MAFNELVLPQKIQLDEKTASDRYAKFTAEPYESGYGHTVGNSLRRILLSGMEGAAVTAVRIKGAVHEFCTLPNVREDVINILLNLKQLRIKMDGKNREYVTLNVAKPGAVTAADIEEVDVNDGMIYLKGWALRYNSTNSDIEVVCVGGMYEQSNKVLQEKYGVEIINDANEMVKKVDAVMITCRDGKYHAQYAMPFVMAGKPLFIDKPFTVSIEEAEELVRVAKEKGALIVGGSSVKSAYDVLMLENAVKTNPKDVRGGTLVAPVNMQNEYGGFFFYSSHLAEMCLRVFGNNPIAVTAKAFGGNVVALVEYEDYVISLQFVGDSYVYFGQTAHIHGGK